MIVDARVDKLVQLDEQKISRELQVVGYFDLKCLQAAATTRLEALASAVGCPTRLKDRLINLILSIGLELSKRRRSLRLA